MNIEHFREQHVSISASMLALRNLIQAGIHNHAGTITSSLPSLTAQLKLHQVAQERVLYPALATYGDPGLDKLSRRSQSELAEIVRQFGEFACRWSSIGALIGTPERFQEEAHSLFALVEERMQKEKKELYLAFESVQELMAA